MYRPTCTTVPQKMHSGEADKNCIVLIAQPHSVLRGETTKLVEFRSCCMLPPPTPQTPPI